MKQYGFPKYERISGDKRISRLFSAGKWGFCHPFRYVVGINRVVQSDCYEGESEAPDESSVRPTAIPGIALLISVPKRNHKRANKRNLLKRRSREAFRTSNAELRDAAVEAGVQIDISLVYSTKDEADYKTIENAIRKILREIAESI